MNHFVHNYGDNYVHNINAYSRSEKQNKLNLYKHNNIFISVK